MNCPGDFFRQRIRWTSKSRYYRDRDVTGTAMQVFLANVCLMAALVAGVLQPVNLWLLLVLLLMKSIPDLALLSGVLHYYRRRKLLWLFLPLEIIYFVYVSVTGFAGLFMTYSWKGRKFSARGNPSMQDMV